MMVNTSSMINKSERAEYISFPNFIEKSDKKMKKKFSHENFFKF